MSYTEADYERFEREAQALDLDRIRTIVVTPMWCHEAEDACKREFGISIAVAIYYVERAVKAGLIRMGYGRVSPT